MQIQKIAQSPRKVRVEYRVNKKTGVVRIVPIEGYKKDHDPSRLIPPSMRDDVTSVTQNPPEFEEYNPHKKEEDIVPPLMNEEPPIEEAPPEQFN